jgi:hypothetical protein
MGRSWDQVADEKYAVCLEVLAERKLMRRATSALALQ